jgi:cobaltochelatase CobS
VSVKLPNGYTNGVFLAGEASSGKTTGAKMLAEALGLRWHFNGAISFPHEMLGFIDGAGKYHRTPFREAYEFGGVYTFDEVDRSDPVALLAVNPHLANGVATFPDKQVKRHKDCYIICTANTWGLGADANYSGATKLDAAFLSRFPIKLAWDIDPVLEEKIVTNAGWLARVRKARGNARAVGLKVMIDTRAAMAGQSLIEAGYTEDEAAGMTYLANLKPEQRKQVEA